MTTCYDRYDNSHDYIIPSSYDIDVVDDMVDARSHITYVADALKNPSTKREGDKNKMYYKTPKIKNIILNGPATIVMWEDNTKTVVKCTESETYDAEKGLCMAICKKLYGSDFKKEFTKKLTKAVEESLTR